MGGLQRRRAALLAEAQDAAEAAAAAAAGADVVAEQAEQRAAAAARRVQVKQQAAAILARHLARQLLVRALLQHEQAAVQGLAAAAAGARADAELALQAALERLPRYAEPQQQARELPGVQQQQGADASSAVDDPVGTAQRLLAVRAQLQALQAQLQGGTLPAQQAVLQRLRSLLYGGSGGGEAADAAAAGEEPAGVPELSAPELRARLAAAAAAHTVLEQQANALVAEVLERQSASQAPRALAERVLLDFWGDPARLVARAAAEQRKLATFGTVAG